MSSESSWFRTILGEGYHTLEEHAQALSWPLASRGHTWLEHGPIHIDHMLGGALVLAIIAVLSLGVRRQYANPQARLIPDATLGFRAFTELLVGGFYKMMSEVMGREAASKFLPLIGTCGIFILFSNLLGLVPGFSPPTDTLNTTLPMALVVIVFTHAVGLREHGIAYLKHFAGPVRGWVWLPLMLLVTAIELFSHFLIRPGTLALRLMANMTADHMVLSIFHNLHPVLAYVVPVAVYLLGFLVCVVQTVVFCMLSTVYVALAVAHDEH